MRIGAVGFLQALALLAMFRAAPAMADLYRWVDPESGSVKFSSYPPPWYGNAQSAQRVPKVEVIPAMKTAPAFAPATDADRAGADKGADRNGERDASIKLASRRIAAFVAAPPDAAAKAYADMLEALRDLEQMEKQGRFISAGEQSAYLEEKAQLASPLEARRTALMQQLSAQRAPPQGAAPEAVENLWRATQQRLAALEWTNEAMNLLDPRKVNARHFEMRAVSEKVAEIWEPYVEAGFGRRDSGR